MKIKGKINLICAVESGVSKATGNPWKSREIVIEFEDGGFGPSTMALRTMNEEVIKTLETCLEGDEVEVDVFFRSDYREFHRQDGSIGCVRNTNCGIRSLEVKEQKAF